ncbi:MAG: hypothetical protein ACLFU4_03245 [Opitutales bacterium]
MNYLCKQAFRHLTAFGLLGLISLPLLHGQTGEENEPVIRAKFTVYSLERFEGLKYLQGDRSTAASVNFFSSSRSPVYEYEGPNPIVFFKEFAGPKASEAGDLRRRVVGQISIPEPGGEYLFIFFPDSQGGDDRYAIYPLPDSPRELPYGTIRFFNATSFTLHGIVGGDRVRFPPGPSEPFRVRGGQLSVGFGFTHEGKFHQSFNSPLNLESGARGLLMIFPPFVKGSAILQTRFLQDHPNPEENALTE